MRTVRAIWALIFLSFCSTSAKDFALLWIGNSLSQGAPTWCQGEGWEWTNQVMVNPRASTLGLHLWSGSIMRGATDLPAHWNADVAAGEGPCTGIGELTEPTGCNNRTGMADWIADQGHYDYVILQGYRWAPPYATELDYASRYCDLALAHGTVPILFACWEDPSLADSAIATYDSLYRKYKNRGAIVMPVIQAHRLVWNDPTKDAVSYLYAPSDAYHHESSVGTFLNACVFFETFTGQSSVGITLADMLPYCSDLNTALTDADVAYCEAKAHQAMIAYYGAGNLPHLGMSPLEWLAIYEVGNPRTAKTWTLTSNDVFLSQTVSSAITATKKQAWLSVSVNSSNPSNQIITATIDPTSFASGEQKYYDTIVVHVGNGIADRSLPVCAWVRSPSTIASITVTPNAAAGSIGQTIQFSAKAFDQYDQAFSPQPTFSWTAEGGTITGSALLTVTSCSGTFKITASAASVSGNATVVVKMLSTARSATASVSSLESGHTASALNDGVIAGYPADASKEWSSNGEKAGAWAQLTWPTAVTIDSIALWDRPNTTDQVTSATLTFSDGSSLAVGSLPNNASTPWSQKFAAKTVTWAKVTVNTVLAGTVNAGLAEFETFNTTACAGTEVLGHATINDVSRLQLGAIAKGILVNAPLNESWSLDLYTLNGTKISTIVGRGSELVAPTALKNKKGFVVALLKSATATLSETVLCK